MNKAILVNKDNKIKERYYKNLELVSTLNINNEEIKIEKETYEQYLKLKSFLQEKNIEIGIKKAYISLEENQEIYNSLKMKYKEEYRVLLSETDEHPTGLAIDISIKINNEFLKDSSEIITNIEKYEEIHKALKNYGFILRYPKDKENITGSKYKPWHIRYVGEIISNIISDRNWTLEEYLNEFSGVIVVNKEKNMTSFDVVNEISHLFGIKKVGHTGTLDPLAEGVLIICIGKATKIVELLTAKDKEYIAGVKLGIKTDTYDITGTILEEKEVEKNMPLEEVINSYKKTYNQEVPIYSAVKVNGKKLYEYARNNKEVELPKKEVTIKEIKLLDKTNDTFTIKTLVSKGTYIRSLINDIGNTLNTYATMKSLKRTKQGQVRIEDAYTLEEIKNNRFKIYEINEVLEYPSIVVDKQLEYKITNGMKLKNEYKIKDKVLFINENGKLLGIYQNINNELRVWKNF